MIAMTNKPMLSIDRELIQRIADHCKFWVDHPYLEAIADVEVELRSILDNPACIKCNDTGEADSGGVQPWGEGINIPCDCELPDHQHGKPVAWVNDQQLLLCSKSPRVVDPENPMMHNLPRNIAGSALRTDYCDTPLFAEQSVSVMPDDWEDHLFAEMSRRFDLRKMIDDDHMVYDDTQIGVEFARDWVKARLSGVKP